MLRGSIAATRPTVQNAVPTSGQTVTVQNDGNDTILYLNPAGLLAALTVALPADSASSIGQVVRIASSKAVTALTVNGATILGAPVGLALGDNIGFQKVAANTWHRLT